MISIVFTIISCNNSKKKEISNTLSKQDKLQVLLIGSSHWGNYKQKGLDVTQANEIDILSKKHQKELELIAGNIAEFKPDKIFVERTPEYQPKLDSLYDLYRNSDWGLDKRNEITQLGFRVANKLSHKKVYGIDYKKTVFPYDSLMTVMKNANQEELINQFEQKIKGFEKRYNSLVSEEKPLIEILNHLNSKEERKLNLGSYLSEITKAGEIQNHVGSYLTSEWMRRNIYMYSLIQKYTEETDEKIMILLGAGHIAVIENLINYNPEWEIVELNEIVK